ncbi:hypothetical protein ACFY4H_34230 [Streptomyces althioticus]|uniref:hypothetical protein n=1 Tax=Streptomyces althioticus TaxID=83380 RepID=UPI0036CDF7C0
MLTTVPGPRSVRDRRPRHPHIRHLRKHRFLRRLHRVRRHRVVRRQAVHLVDGLLAVLLRLEGCRVIGVAVDLGDRGDVVDRLAVGAGVARGHGLADRGEARTRRQYLGADDVGVVRDALGRLDEAVCPLGEGGVGLALPVDAAAVLLEFLRRCPDGVPRLDEGLGRRLQEFGVGRLDDVDHVVEVVALEVRGTEVDAPLVEGPERDGEPRHVRDRVEDAVLLLGFLAFLQEGVLLLLVPAHQYPASV